MPTLAVLLCLTLSVAWHTVRDEDGVKIQQREVPGEKYDELSAEAHSELPVEAFDAYLFGVYLDNPGSSITRQMIRRTKDVAVWHDVVRTPVVSDRDFVMKFTRRFDPETRVLQVDFNTVENEGPKEPAEGCVRMRVRGSWTFEPNGTGTDVRYVVFTDIGGSVPAFVIRGAQVDETERRFRKVLSEAKPGTAVAK